jgi:putative transposase
LNGLKKSLGYSVREKRTWIEPGHPGIAIYRQCELLGLSRSGYYYEPQGQSALNEHLMNLIDEQYTKMPFYGVEKMTEWLRRQGFAVNPKRIRRLMRLMGLEAVYPKPWLSRSTQGHKKYPYLLRDLGIQRADQVWCADITYIRMLHGFLYLVAVMDWYSRYVLAWELSNTLDKQFCLDALERALALSQPEIFNSDQGSQFTSTEFTGRLEAARVRISMDGRGRVFDNIFIERLWRTVKYEEVYLKSYESVREARNGLARYFQLYNTERLHEALGYRTPQEVYCGASRNDNGQAGLFHLKEAVFLS